MNTPRRAHEVSLGWLNSVLAPELGAPVDDFELEVIGAGVGLIGELARINLRHAQPTDGPRSIVAKFSAPSDDVRAFGNALRFYEMESNFYRDLRPRVQLNAPRSYFNDYDPGTGHSTLLMSDAKGVTVDQLEGCPPSRAVAVAREIANLHTTAYSQNWLREFPWVRSMIDREMIAAERKLLEVSVPIAVEKFRTIAPDWFFPIAEDFPDLVRLTAHRLDAFPQTVIHGDLRVDNLIFDDFGDVTLVDWQIVMAGPGLYDLVYFMTQSMNVQDRRSAEGEILSAYDNAVGGSGMELSAESRNELIGLCCLTLLSYPIHNAPTMDDGPKRSGRLIRTMFQRACAAVEDYGALELVDGILAGQG